MPEAIYFDVFLTVSGWIGVCGTDAGLRRITLPQSTEKQARQIILDSETREAIFAPGRFNGLTGKLKAYFQGQQVQFEEKLDISDATSFQRDVWQATREIPFGQTRSYGRIAKQIGRPEASRAVGQALGKNPLPIIIPCHRVMSSDGGLGGFTGGIEMKKSLLRTEGALA